MYVACVALPAKCASPRHRRSSSIRFQHSACGACRLACFRTYFRSHDTIHSLRVWQTRACAFICRQCPAPRVYMVFRAIRPYVKGLCAALCCTVLRSAVAECARGMCEARTLANARTRACATCLSLSVWGSVRVLSCIRCEICA